MSYALIDQVLLSWAEKHNVSWATQYQDTEVRSITLVNADGRQFQIWVDPPSPIGIDIHVWDYKKKRKDISANNQTLAAALDQALRMVKGWMNESV